VYYQDHMGAGRWVFMALVAVVLLGLLAAFVVWLVRDQRQRPHRFHHFGGASALEILDRRLATGEIGIEEYERVKTSLATPVPAPAPTVEPPGTASP
jgi:uncharacterized membrane protein